MPLKNIDFDFHDNPNPMWIADPNNHQIVDVNDAALSLYEYSKEEMLSLSTKDLQTEDKNFSKNPGRPRNTEGTREHITKDGESVYVQVTCHTIQIDGETLRLFVGNNVTEQARREQQLRISQHLFELINKKLPLSLFVLDQQENMHRWNCYAEDLSEYSSEMMPQLHALDFFDSNSQPKIKQALQEVWEKGKVEVEGKLLAKSGDNVSMLCKAHRVEIDGEKRILGFGVDISELKEAQEKIDANRQLLQAIIDQSKSLIFIKDEEGRFRFVNKEFLSFFDLSADDVIGQRDLDIMYEEDARPMQQSDKKVREEKGPLELEEHVQLDGQTHTFLTTKVLLQDIPGFENHVFGLSRDITQRKQMEQQLKKSAKEKEVLLSEIHHRVKNNLAIISGFLDLQAMETDDMRLRDNLKDSQSRILSIASTHEPLYEEQDFSTISFDSNIKKLTQQIADTLSPEVTFRFTMDSVELNINQAIPCSLIINEVVTNAIKHAYDDQEEAVIDITLREEEGTILLSVRDYGKGIPENVDLENTRSLGLKLIHVLKEQLDAKLTINSKEGTRFNIIFEKTAVKGSSSTITNGDHSKRNIV